MKKFFEVQPALTIKGEGYMKFQMNGISGTSKDEHADSNTNDPSKMTFFIITPLISYSDDYGCFSTSSTTFNKLGELGFVKELKLARKLPFLSNKTL